MRYLFVLLSVTMVMAASACQKKAEPATQPATQPVAEVEPEVVVERQIDPLEVAGLLRSKGYHFELGEMSDYEQEQNRFFFEALSAVDLQFDNGAHINVLEYDTSTEAGRIKMERGLKNLAQRSKHHSKDAHIHKNLIFIATKDTKPEKWEEIKALIQSM